MRITGNINALNIFSSANRVNTTALQNKNAQNSSTINARRDSAKISPMGKLNSMLEDLSKQKDRIIERKTALIGKTLEKTRNLDGIQPQLENMDEQIIGIEKQMTDLIAAQMEKSTKQAEEKAKKDDEPKTEEEIAAKEQNELIKVSTDVKAAATILSSKNKIEASVNVENGKIRTGKIRIDTMMSKALGGENAAPMIKSAKKIIKAQEEVASALHNKGKQIEANFFKEINTIIPEEKQKATEQIKEENTNK
ncbi:MAG: hypothetical protein RR115_06025 [Hydrogenoanaerobacterium sp.]